MPWAWSLWCSMTVISHRVKGVNLYLLRCFNYDSCNYEAKNKRLEVGNNKKGAFLWRPILQK